ncbi:MAG: HAD family hydrolase [Acholeplasmataceae bacterium]
MKTILWDFNGTILDDARLCHDILNRMLVEAERPPVTFEEYLMVFTFPIKDYYAKVYDLKKTSFDYLARRFIDFYQPESLALTLHENVLEVITYFAVKGYRNVLLSASEINNLRAQLEHFRIDHLFDDILGIDDIRATSKAHVAKAFMQKEKLDPKDVVVIGDTLHDAEVAKAINARIILYSKGHQHRSRLEKHVLIDDFYRLIDIID